MQTLQLPITICLCKELCKAKQKSILNLYDLKKKKSDYEDENFRATLQLNSRFYLSLSSTILANLAK